MTYNSFYLFIYLSVHTHPSPPSFSFSSLLSSPLPPHIQTKPHKTPPSQPLDDSDLLPEREDIGQGPDGRDGEGVDLRVALGVVAPDVQEVGGGREGRRRRAGRVPVQVPQPGVDGRVAAADVADVALEVLHVDRVEANQGYETSVGG